MADPLSIIASTAGLIDLSVKLAQFVRDTKKGTDVVNKDLEQLAKDIDSVNNNTKVIRDAFDRHMTQTGFTVTHDARAWREVAAALQSCHAVLKDWTNN